MLYHEACHEIPVREVTVRLFCVTLQSVSADSPLAYVSLRNSKTKKWMRLQHNRLSLELQEVY
jgi:hypothetical protein